MSALSQAIAEEYYTEKWKNLVVAVKQVEHAPPAVAELEPELARLDKALEAEGQYFWKLELSTQKEKRRWEKVRDSSRKRFWAKLTNGVESLSEREQREEQEYLEALAVEEAAQARIDAFQSEKEQIAEQLSQLVPLAEKHKLARTELDALYDRIFKGPTPEFPQEDSVEQTVVNAEQQDWIAQTYLTNQLRCQDLIRQSLEAMKQAKQRMENAREYSTMAAALRGDMLLVRDELAFAADWIRKYGMLLDQAAFLSPQLGAGAFGDTPIQDDAGFTSLLNDVNMHGKMSKAMGKVEATIEQITDKVLPLAEKLVVEATAAKKTTSDKLRLARKTLDSIRDDIMEARGEPAPEYRSMSPSSGCATSVASDGHN